MSESNLTPEHRDHAMGVIGQTFDLAANKMAAGRSSMPITIEDALLLAGLAVHGLDAVLPAPTTIRTPDATPDGSES